MPFRAAVPLDGGLINLLKHWLCSCVHLHPGRLAPTAPWSRWRPSVLQSNPPSWHPGTCRIQTWRQACHSENNNRRLSWTGHRGNHGWTNGKRSWFVSQCWPWVRQLDGSELFRRVGAFILWKIWTQRFCIERLSSELLGRYWPVLSVVAVVPQAHACTPKP